jgi:hypothetical protein
MPKHLTSKMYEVYESPSIPERDLLAACLERAIRDILNKPDQTGSKEIRNNHNCREALGWLRSSSMRPFSFRWLCQHLDISPKAVRRYIYELKASGKKFDVFNGSMSANRGIRTDIPTTKITNDV